MRVTVYVSFAVEAEVPDEMETDFDVASYLLPLTATIENVTDLSVAVTP